ncbi:MAG TPA: amidohydrolase family protein [Bryobacteraceae bacterium]|nr:amidohydrolase family protein [Bryobacteraceae bacterium]
MESTRRQFLAAAGSTAVLSAAPTSYRIIDPHVHVWKRDSAYPFAKETKHPPDFDATPEMLLGLMRANGVSKTVIIQVIHYLWDNRYLAHVLKQYPDYFHGVARVNPESPDAPDDLSRLVEEQGFRGVRISPSAGADGDWIRRPLMPPLWRRCEDLRVAMTVLAPVTRMPDVEKLVAQFPGLNVVIDHMADCPLGHPELLAKLTALARYPKVFVKVSHTWSLSKLPYPYLDAQMQVKQLYDVFGPQRLMWGTDWPIDIPYCGYAKALAMVRDEMKFLNADDKHWMLSKTIERVWPFS